MTQPIEQRLQVSARPFGHHFDGAIPSVGYPARQTERFGLALRYSSES